MQKIKKIFGFVALAFLLIITGIILFDRLVPPQGERLVFSLDDTICVMNANGWHKQCLIEGTKPTWSPDGQQIAFEFKVQPEDYWPAIYTMTDTGSNLTQLTFENRYGEHPAWSPDGTQIALSSKQIYVIDSDGTSWQVLTDGDIAKYHPAWSPDGQQIAFAARVSSDERIDIYVMNADGSKIRQLTDDPAHDDRPDWSPDGKKIAFESKRDGNWEIYVVDVDGSNLTRLTDHPKRDQGPVWSPDGSRIAFLSGRSGRTGYIWSEDYRFEVYDIFVMNADGTQVRRLTYGFGKHEYEDIDWSSQ